MKNMKNVECILEMLLLEELFHFLAFLRGEGLFKVGTFSIFVVLNSHILCMQSRQNDLQTNSDF